MQPYYVIYETQDYIPILITTTYQDRKAASTAINNAIKSRLCDWIPVSLYMCHMIQTFKPGNNVYDLGLLVSK